MPDAAGGTRDGQRKLGRFLAVTAALVCLVVATVWLGVALYLPTPPAARQVSSFLSEYLHIPVTVAGLRFTGGTLSARGLSLASPPGFAERDLATARAIEIRPDWLALLSGKKTLARIAVTGLRVTLARNGEGEWNFKELAHLAAGRKEGGETFLRRLAVTDASLAMDGVVIDHLSLAVTDLSTRGTTESRLLLAFRDPCGTPFRLEGSARLGPAPALDAVLTAPEIPLTNYRKLVAAPQAVDLTRGTGSLSIGVNFRNGKVSAAGRVGLGRVSLALGKGVLPLKAALEFTGRYDSRADEASLDAATLAINDTVRAHASGTVRGVRKARRFAAKVSLEETELRRLAGMLPPGVSGGLAVAGVMHPALFTLAGDAAHGISTGTGAIRLSGGAVSKGGEPLVRGVSAEISLSGGSGGWEASGHVFQGKGAGGELLQDLDARLGALLSPRLKIVRAGVPSFSARIAGIPASGRIGYLPGATGPFTARVAVARAPVAAANRFLAGKKAVFSGGTLTLDIQASGKGPRDFRGELQGGAADIEGEVAGKRVVIGSASLDAGFGVTGGQPTAAGHLDGRGSVAGSGTVAVTTGFALAAGTFSLSQGTVISDRARIEFASVRGSLPVPVSDGAGGLIPLRMQLDGVSARSGEVRISGFSGAVGMDYRPGREGQRLAGGGRFAVSDLVYAGNKVGSLEGRLESAATGVMAQVDGTVLSGRLHGTVSADPFASRENGSFRLRLGGVKGGELAPFVPAGAPVRIADGSLSADLEGEYAAGQGVSCRFAADGVGVSLTGATGKPLLSDGRFHVSAALKGDSLAIREGTVAAGDGVAVTIQGEVAHLSSPSRMGSVSLALPATPFAALIQAFDGLLPDKFRTAAARGSLSGKGEVRIAAGSVGFDGDLSLVRVGIDVPDQQISISDATGTIPVSLVFSGEAEEAKRVRPTFRKENYANLLDILRRSAKKGADLTVGKVRFGPLEAGETSFGIRAEHGVMEITSLKSNLLKGTLLGAGFAYSGKRIRYGLDLVVNDLSLRTLCDAYPNIRGYISGKVDGIVSLYGEGAGLNALRGFTDIWTRGGPDEEMLVSKEFLQKLAGRKLKGLFFRSDRPYDRGEIRGYLERGYLTFEVLDISHTNMFGIKDLSVSVAPVQNKISLMHLLASIRAAATRGKAAAGGEGAPPAPAETEFKWQE